MLLLRNMLIPLSSISRMGVNDRLTAFVYQRLSPVLGTIAGLALLTPPKAKMSITTEQQRKSIQSG